MVKKQKPKVLVVDDDKSVLFTYRLLLERQGYQTAAVVSSVEAKRELDTKGFDLLLCDLSLEENQSGFEVIQYARELQPGLACILLTGYASSDAAQRAEAIGVQVLYKPIEIEEFVNAIAAILRETNAKDKTGSGQGHRKAAQG